MIITSIYFKYISKEWVYIHCFFFTIAFIGLLMSFKLPESPKFLLSKGFYDKARKSFNHIAKMNKK
jgi:hypothetical protein